jgi:hypothetical protein
MSDDMDEADARLWRICEYAGKATTMWLHARQMWRGMTKRERTSDLGERVKRRLDRNRRLAIAARSILDLPERDWDMRLLEVKAEFVQEMQSELEQHVASVDAAYRLRRSRFRVVENFEP